MHLAMRDKSSMAEPTDWEMVVATIPGVGSPPCTLCHANLIMLLRSFVIKILPSDRTH